MTDYNAKLSYWRFMAMMVAKEFKLRPSEVMTEWESLEVLVTFGVIMNDISLENWNSYKATLPNYKAPTPDSKYAVFFRTHEMIQYEHKYRT